MEEEICHVIRGWSFDVSLELTRNYNYQLHNNSLLYRFAHLCAMFTTEKHFQDYMNDTNGKEILLQYVTVKVPGKTPKGSKSYNAQGIAICVACVINSFDTYVFNIYIFFLQKIVLNFLSSPWRTKLGTLRQTMPRRERAGLPR